MWHNYTCSHLYTIICLHCTYMFMCMYNTLPTSRELKRLSTVTLSPIYAHFSETLTGLPTIRALRASRRFMTENEEKLTVNQRANFGSKSKQELLHWCPVYCPSKDFTAIVLYTCTCTVGRTVLFRQSHLASHNLKYRKFLCFCCFFSH